MKKLLDKIPLGLLIAMTVLMSLLPFRPEPHLVEKIRMLTDGTLSRPIDIFDLFWHGIWGVLLLLKLAVDLVSKGQTPSE